ncbi:MAG TPA: hypothetical protein VF755_20470, partial [Catenuloplanes sp.]
MTVVVPVESPATAPEAGNVRSAGGGRWRRAARCSPALAVAVLAAGTLHDFGVGGRDLVVFALYLTLGVGLPGLLLW